MMACFFPVSLQDGLQQRTFQADPLLHLHLHTPFTS
jgi:hypothetical protein